MQTANAIGPARSPTVLLTPRPCSAKVEAHWLTACSLAPALIIMRKRIQNSFIRKSAPRLSPFSPSGTSGAIGTRRKRKKLKSGIRAQSAARIFQFAMPKSAKNTVEIRTTPTWPQQ